MIYKLLLSTYSPKLNMTSLTIRQWTVYMPNSRMIHFWVHDRYLVSRATVCPNTISGHTLEVILTEEISQSQASGTIAHTFYSRAGTEGTQQHHHSIMLRAAMWVTGLLSLPICLWFIEHQQMHRGKNA